MKQKTLSPIEHKYYHAQMSIDGVGLEGQERLLNSTVAVIGLSAVGISVVRGLVAAGVGNIHVIDDGTVDENSLSIQTLFDVDDIGKLKCIVLKDKELWKRGKDKLHLHVVRLTKENARFILPDNCQLLVCAIYDVDIIRHVFELADTRNLCIVGGGAFGWEGVFGVYAGQNNVHFKNRILAHYSGKKQHLFGETAMSGLSFAVGGMIVSLSLTQLLGQCVKTSFVYQFNAQTFSMDLINELQGK